MSALSPARSRPMAGSGLSVGYFGDEDAELLLKSKLCTSPMTQPHKKRTAMETQIKPNRLHKSGSVSVTLLHVELEERSDTHGVNRSPSSKDGR